MKALLKKLRTRHGLKLTMLHSWNGWIVLILAISGLILLQGQWRGILGEGRVWLKWLHIVVGIISILPVFYYLFLANKHWKQLKEKPWQRFNVIVVLSLLVGWFISGVLLWLYRLIGPVWTSVALDVHDVLTWVGLPYIIYHAITRVKWLKEPHRRTVKTGKPNEAIQGSGSGIHPAAAPSPIYTRRTFIRGLVGAGIVLTLTPTFLKWLNGGMSSSGEFNVASYNDINDLKPAPQPLNASSPPVGGGTRGHFRVYSVTPIPEFTNQNWSFTIDGLVDQPMKWDWEKFVKLKRKAQVSDFHCITGWSVYDSTWEGIPLKELLQQAGVQSSAKTVKFYSGDGEYTDSLSLDQVDTMGDVMVVVMHDGKAIPSDLGGPARLIVPQMYAYKAVKWLTRIELIEDDHTGYWEKRGYPKEAWL